VSRAIFKNNPRLSLFNQKLKLKMSDETKLDALMDLFTLAGRGDAKGLARFLKTKKAHPNDRWRASEKPSSAGLLSPVWAIEAGQLAVGYAAGEGKAAAVAFLAPISDLSIVDEKGDTALISGAFFGDPDCAKAMLAAIKDASVVNAKGAKGETALMAAARRGQDSYVKALLADSRCDAALVSDNGETAFELATNEANWETAALLSPFVSDSKFNEWAAAMAAGTVWFDAFDTPGLHERIPLEIAKIAVASSKNPAAEMPKTLARVEAWELGAIVKDNDAAPGAETSEALTRRRPLSL